MAAPFTQGKKYTTTQSVQRPVRGGGYVTLVTEYDSVDGRRQSRPIDTVLSYYRQRSTVTNWIGHAYSEDGAGWAPVNPSWEGPYLTKAYETMRGRIMDSSELGTFLAEYRESHKLVLGTLSTLIGVAKDLKKGDLTSAAKRLRLRSDRPRKVNPKRLEGYEGAARQLASNWLGYVFGVEPFVKDLYEGLDFMQEPLRALSAHGSAGTGLYKTLSTDTVTTGSGGKTVKTYSKHRMEEFRVRVGCRVRISNPHLHFLDQAGLINPAALLWESIPFTVVADWFGTMGSAIRSMSDFAGLDVEMAYTTRKHNWTTWSSDRQVSTIDGNFYCATRATGSRLSRQPGLPILLPKLKPLALPSARRIATGSALLVSLLPQRKG